MKLESSTYLGSVARWHFFKPKNLIRVNVGIICGHLVYFTAIWYIYFMDIWCSLWSFGTFSFVLVNCTEKNLATLHLGELVKFVQPQAHCLPTWGLLLETRLTAGWPGVDVMITIFCDFWQFWAKKLAFFSNTNVMIKILHNLALFGVKDANFSLFFGENI
jgi:hypothetical protein